MVGVANLGNKEPAAAAAVLMAGSGGEKTTRAEETKAHEAVFVEGNSVVGAAVVIPPAAAPVDLRAVERILGYTFGDKALVEMALTHASYYHRPDDTGEVQATGPSYERLEFVGDAVLNCVVARFLYWEYEELPPGPLTKLRSANVDTEKLARVAVRSGLYKYLRHKAPYLFVQIEEFRKTMSDYPLHSNGLLDTPKVLADVVEALLGAVFVDSNDIDAVWKVFERLWDPLIRLETLGKHPTSELYELCQKKGMAVRFQTAAWKETNAVEVLVDGKLAGRGTYGQKKEVAQSRAAKAALDHLKMMFADCGGGGQSHPEEMEGHMVVREEMNDVMSSHTSSGESDDDGKTAVMEGELQDHMPAGREVVNNLKDLADNGGGGGQSHPKEMEDHMVVREEMNDIMSSHTSSGESDDDGKIAVTEGELQYHMPAGREVVNNMKDLADGGGGQSHPEEMEDHMVVREEMNDVMSSHTSSGESDDDGKTAVTEGELQDHMPARGEVVNNMKDLADDGGGGGQSHPEEMEDHMVVREEMNDVMSSHTSSGESDDDGKTAVTEGELQDHMPAGREVVNNMKDLTPSDDGETASCSSKL